MTPRHHLDAATLLGYSAGSLPTAFAAVAATHIGLCPHCRAQLHHADRLGGILLQQQEPAPLPATARQAMLARLREEPHGMGPAVAAPAAASDADQLPAPLRPFFGETYSGLRWRRVAPGLQTIRGPALPAGNIVLLRVAPGRSVPEHGHRGNELTVVLRGAYDDVLGHFAAGDAADVDLDTQHQPVTAPGEPCICVAATDARLRFSGWLARVLQPVLRF